MATTDIAKYAVRLEAQIGEYAKGLKKSNTLLTNFARNQKRTLKKVDTSFAQFGGTIKIVLAALAGSQLVRITDRFNKLSTRVKTATRDTGDFAAVQKELADIAISTGTAFESSVATFQALSRIREDVGATNSQLLTLTRTVSQLGVIGGASTEAIRNGLRQFNQGLAAGIFRAEEFNSIVENLPELGKRIADGFGVTQGELRKMVIEGKLLSTDVMKVLLSQAGDIAAQFQEIPSDLERATSSLTTAIGAALSAFDKAAGITSTLAKDFERIAQLISVSSGTASPASALELQLDNLFIKLARLQEAFDTENAGLSGAKRARYYDNLEVQIEKVRQQIEGTREALRFFQGEVDTTLTPASNATAEPNTPFKLGRDETTTREDVRVQGIIDVLKAEQDAAKDRIEQEKEVQAMFEEISKERTDRINAQAEQFGDLFAANLVQAAEGGFDNILKQWVRTLQQMLARAVAIKLFQALFPSGIGVGGGGGGVGGFLSGLLKFDKGGTVPGPIGAPQLAMVHGGEKIFPPNKSQGFTMNQTVNIAPGVSRSEVAHALTVGKEQTKAELVDMLRRGQ